MHAANFTTHSLGIAVHSFLMLWGTIHSYPHLFYRALAQGMYDLMPVHTASKTQPDQPVYVTNVQYEMSAGMIFGSFFPELQAFQGEDSLYKYCLCHTQHPVDKVFEEVLVDWNKYQKMFKEQGSTKPDLDYPYTKEWYQQWHEAYSKRLVPISINGPTAEEKKKVVDTCRYNKAVMNWSQIPELIRASALPSSCRTVDRYQLAWAKTVHAERSKITASASTSAADFDPEEYEAWNGWTSGDCSVQVVDNVKSDGLQHAPQAWEIITKILEGAKATIQK